MKDTLDAKLMDEIAYAFAEVPEPYRSRLLAVVVRMVVDLYDCDLEERADGLMEILPGWTSEGLLEWLDVRTSDDGIPAELLAWPPPDVA